jgi:hypothetical protein
VARSAVTSPSMSRTSTPASCIRSRALRRAFGTKCHARDLPPLGRQLDRPDPAAAAEVKRLPIGRLASCLLAGEQRGDLLDDRR